MPDLSTFESTSAAAEPQSVAETDDFTFSNELEGIDDWLFWTYASMAMWPVGDFFAIPVGGAVYSYYSFAMWYNLIELMDGKGSWEEWFHGPFRRAVVGEIIFAVGLTFSTIPFVNILTSWACVMMAVPSY